MKHPILSLAVYNSQEYTEENYLEKATKDCLKDFAETLFGEYLKQDLSINDSFFFHFIELKYAVQMDIDPSLERLKIHFNSKDLADYCKKVKYTTIKGPGKDFVYSYKEELVPVSKKDFMKKEKAFKEAVENCFNNVQFPVLTFHVIELAGRTYSFYTLER